MDFCYTYELHELYAQFLQKIQCVIKLSRFENNIPTNLDILRELGIPHIVVLDKVDVDTCYSKLQNNLSYFISLFKNRMCQSPNLSDLFLYLVILL